MGEEDRMEWMRFAEDDLDAARFLLGMTKRRLEIICYHCQQCAEKALKSLYALEDLDVPKTHDFGIISSGLTSIHDFTSISDSFAQLQPFAVAVRYPYDIEVLPGDEEKAIVAAETILSICKSIMKDSAL